MSQTSGETEEVPEIEGMEHVGWYQPHREPGEQLWPARLVPSEHWGHFLPVYAPKEPTPSDRREASTADSQQPVRAGEVCR